MPEVVKEVLEAILGGTAGHVVKVVIGDELTDAVAIGMPKFHNFLIKKKDGRICERTECQIPVKCCTGLFSYNTDITSALKQDESLKGLVEHYKNRFPNE
jgi:hypothetical protein